MVVGHGVSHQEGRVLGDGRYSSGCENERVSLQEKHTDMDVIVEEKEQSQKGKYCLS